MRQYRVKIDNDEIDESFSYAELLVNDILEHDDILIRPDDSDLWCQVGSFCFPEERELFGDDVVDRNRLDYWIDEFGQVHIEMK